MAVVLQSVMDVRCPSVVTFCRKKRVEIYHSTNRRPRGNYLARGLYLVPDSYALSVSEYRPLAIYSTSEESHDEMFHDKSVEKRGRRTMQLVLLNAAEYR